MWIRRVFGPIPIFIGAILESSIIPFPFELVLISSILHEPNIRRAFVLASAAVAGCLDGSTAFYVIGQFAFDTLGLPLAHHLGIAVLTVYVGRWTLNRIKRSRS